MARYANWIEEIYSLLKDAKDDNLFEYAKTTNFEHRFSAAFFGIYCTDKNPKAKVNLLLRSLNFPRLSHRSFPDALFIYAYSALSTLPLNARLDEFFKLTREFSAWYKKNKDSAKPENLETFGALFSTLSLNSSTSPTGTMVTRTISSDDLNDKINFFRENGGLSAFLDFLKNDEATRAFNSRATYYVQKILFDMLKRPLDILHFHNLPEEHRDQYIEARRVSLLSDENFHRFVNKNRLFLENVKTPEFRRSLSTCDGFSSWEEKLSHCIEALSGAKIDYSALALNLLSFLIEDRNVIKSLENEDDFLDVAGIDKETYLKIFKSVDPAKRMTTAISGFVSGKFTVSREFLILFALYAGYGNARLNHVLISCDFLPLDQASDFDRDIMDCASDMARLSDLTNHKLYIGRLGDFSNELYFDARDADKQTNAVRQNYETLYDNLKSKLKLALAYSDPEALALIFEKSSAGDSAREQIKNLLSK